MLEHRLVTEVGAEVVVGNLGLPPADAVHERQTEAVVRGSQVEFVLLVESHERSPLDLELEALRVQHRIGAVPKDRHPAARGHVPHPAIRLRRIERIGRRVVVPDGREPRLLGPREVARVDQVVRQQVPSPGPRCPEVVEAIAAASGRRTGVVTTGAGAVQHHGPTATGRRQRLHDRRPRVEAVIGQTQRRQRLGSRGRLAGGDAPGERHRDQHPGHAEQGRAAVGSPTRRTAGTIAHAPPRLDGGNGGG